MTPISAPSRRSKLAFIVSFALAFACAALGARASVQAASFYAQLSRPDWAPPAWLFGPVWSTLYCMMALAAWRVWCASGARLNAALLVYAAQLLLNALWSWLFFAWHRGALAFVVVLALWLMIAATITLFGRHERLAAILLWPYLAWVSFAAVLCLSVWQRNPAQLG